MSAMEFAPLTGRCFSLAERTAISATLPLLAHAAKLPNSRIWGKIFGFKNDIIIVQCLGTNVLEQPRSYFSVDGGLTFSVLDTPPVSKLQHCALIKGQYMGDPAYEYRVHDAVTGQSVSLKESERMGWFVLQHDMDCRVAPRGALLLNEDGSVRTNATFEGLGFSEAVFLNQYIHVRRPRRNASKLEQEGTYVAADAFDPLVDDVPQGLWNLKFDGMQEIVFGTTALYPGSVFFHRPETQCFGSVYMGDGVVNGDVAFTL